MFAWRKPSFVLRKDVCITGKYALAVWETSTHTNTQETGKYVLVYAFKLSEARTFRMERRQNTPYDDNSIDYEKR